MYDRNFRFFVNRAPARLFYTREGVSRILSNLLAKGENVKHHQFCSKRARGQFSTKLVYFTIEAKFNNNVGIFFFNSEKMSDTFTYFSNV